jgi:hypothetical protein
MGLSSPIRESNHHCIDTSSEKLRYLRGAAFIFNLCFFGRGVNFFHEKAARINSSPYTFQNLTETLGGTFPNLNGHFYVC